MTTQTSKPSKARIIALSCILSFVFMLAPGFIRSFSLSADFVVSYIFYFSAVLLLTRKHPAYKNTILVSFVLVLLVITSLMIGLPMRHGMTLNAIIKNMVGLPNFIWCVWGCISAYLFFNAKNSSCKNCSSSAIGNYLYTLSCLPVHHVYQLRKL